MTKDDSQNIVSNEVKVDSTNQTFENSPRSGGKFFKKNKRNNNKRREKQRFEFDQKILDIRRVTRVASGGRRFNFAVSIVVGDKKGKVGVGTGKAGDTTLAIEKANRTAKRNMITVRKTSTNSIPHEVSAKYCSAKIMIMPAKGKGMVAGSAVRDVVELAGLNDINSKILSGSKNKLNIARATIKALETLKDPKFSIKDKKVVKAK